MKLLKQDAEEILGYSAGALSRAKSAGENVATEECKILGAWCIKLGISIDHMKAFAEAQNIKVKKYDLGSAAGRQAYSTLTYKPENSSVSIRENIKIRRTYAVLLGAWCKVLGLTKSKHIVAFSDMLNIPRVFETPESFGE